MQPALGFNRGRHFRKDIDISATKAVDRLLAIADNEQVRPMHQGELPQQVALQSVGVLKFIDQKIFVALGNPRQHRRMVEQLERAQLQVIKIQDRQSLLFGIEPRFYPAQQTQERQRIFLRQQVVTDGRQLTARTIVLPRFVAKEQRINSLNRRVGAFLRSRLPEIFDRLGVRSDSFLSGRLPENVSQRRPSSGKPCALLLSLR